MSQTFSNQQITDAATKAVVSFSNVQASESDVWNTSDPLSGGNPLVPFSGIYDATAAVKPYDALQWSAMQTYVYGDATMTVTFTYHVAVTDGYLISGLQQGYTIDYNDGANLISAEETAYNNGVQVADMTATGLNGSTAAFDTGYAALDIKVVLKLSVNDPTGNSDIGISQIEQGVSVVSGGPVPIGGGGGSNDGGGGSGSGTISGIAFVDANDSQVVSGTGIAGVTVYLENAAGTVVLQTPATTDGNGGYSFTGLAAGTYTVVFDTPNNYVNSTVVTDTVTVSDNTTATANAGFYIPPSFATTVYLDSNGNGIRDASENVLAGVTVQLEDANGVIVATGHTSSAGTVLFGNLTPGSYQVAVVDPGYVATQQVNVGTVDVLASGQNATALEGLSLPGSLSGHVFLDLNGDGVQQAGDTNLAGLSVQLLDGNGQAVGQTATTDVNGHYQFAGLVPGNYMVQVEGPAGDVFSPVGTGATAAVESIVNVAGVTSAVAVAPGADTPNQNAGMYVPASITGTTFTDNNVDGILGAGDIDLSGVTVTLLSGSTPVASAITGGSGDYSFTGLAPGSYSVVFTTPGGDVATTAVTVAETLVSGSAPVVNAGFCAPAGITGTAFIDNNVNGTLDSTGDVSLAGVKVTLDNAAGTAVAIATTDGSGNYSFANLLPGTYTVVFTTPGGDVVTTPTSDTVTLASGDLAVENAGYYAPASITGTTFGDVNSNGTQDAGDAGLGKVSVSLLSGGATVATTTTSSNGAYSFTGLTPGGYTVSFTTPAGDTATTPISDPVTLASGGTAVENAGFHVPVVTTGAITGTTFIDNNTNGTLDCGDITLAGVTVALLNGTTTVASTTTNATGGYSFTGLLAGTYTVAFTTPTGDVATTAVSDTVVLPAGGAGTANAGFYAPVKITGTTFIDNNVNGTLDTGDVNLASVTVTLKSGTTTLASTTTSSTGGYSFVNLKPGTYTVVFSTPCGDVASTALSDTVTLASGGSAVENAGYYAPAKITGVAFGDKNANGTQDSCESGLSCVTVTLKNAGGTVVATTTTNCSGAYSFTGEKPGTYTVVFTTPGGDVATTPTSYSATLVSGGSAVENAGFYASSGCNGSATISGEVWNDCNANGSLNCGESGLSGTKVQLLNGTGTLVLATATTNCYGNYSFGSLASGSYEIKVLAPSGDVFSPKVTGCGTTSAVAPANGLSSVLTLSSCSSVTVNAGVHPMISFAGGCNNSGSNSNVCGWDDGCQESGGYNGSYGCGWTYNSGCGDYHYQSSGGCSGQSASTAPIKPFASISLADTSTITMTISVTANGVKTDADGLLSGTGLTKTGVGTYTLATASAATLTAEMQALVFTPTTGQVAPGQTVTTGFALAAIDGNGFTDTDSTTKATVTAADTAPTLTQSAISLSVAEGGTLQNLLPTILANAHDVDVGDQAKLTIASIGQSNTAGFVYYDASKGLLTYTADGYNPNKTTDSFTYTIADQHGLTVTGTVNVAITGSTLPTSVGTNCSDTMTLSASNARIDALGGSDSLTISGSNDAVFAGNGNDTVSVTGKSNIIHTGAGSDTINLGSTATGNTIVLGLGGSDAINGASLTNGTKLDLRSLLAQCDINLAGDLTKVSQYFSVANNWGNLSLQYNQASGGCGGSATVAVLNGMNGCTSLATLISSNMLQV